MSLPWFLRYDERPVPKCSAVSVWVYSQWHFLPIAGGLPIFRFCTSESAVGEVLAEYEEEKSLALEILKKSGRAGTKENITKDREVFQKSMSHWWLKELRDDDYDADKNFKIYMTFEQIDRAQFSTPDQVEELDFRTSYFVQLPDKTFFCRSFTGRESVIAFVKAAKLDASAVSIYRTIK